jgi:hypothetical protein
LAKRPGKIAIVRILPLLRFQSIGFFNLMQVPKVMSRKCPDSNLPDHPKSRTFSNKTWFSACVTGIPAGGQKVKGQV